MKFQYKLFRRTMNQSGMLLAVAGVVDGSIGDGGSDAPVKLAVFGLLLIALSLFKRK